MRKITTILLTLGILMTGNAYTKKESTLPVQTSYTYDISICQESNTANCFDLKVPLGITKRSAELAKRRENTPYGLESIRKQEINIYTRILLNTIRDNGYGIEPKEGDPGTWYVIRESGKKTKKAFGELERTLNNKISP